MTPNNRLTQGEQRAFESARQLLGDNLANFLLSGLGETEIIHYRAFTAQSNFSPTENIIYRFQIINESKQGLPSGNDPLVLATLLDLLWERQPLNRKIMFRERDILEKLQWPLTPETEMLVNQSIWRYFSTAYYLIDPTAGGKRRSYSLYASSQRLLIGYETEAILLPLKRTADQRFIKVQFSPDFIHDVISEKKHFLGIDFHGLLGIRET
ncbi:MAG: hypothetical protein WBP93_15905 [Pyrinomonadaceae bacterium]